MSLSVRRLCRMAVAHDASWLTEQVYIVFLMDSEGWED